MIKLLSEADKEWAQRVNDGLNESVVEKAWKDELESFKEMTKCKQINNTLKQLESSIEFMFEEIDVLYKKQKSATEDHCRNYFYAAAYRVFNSLMDQINQLKLCLIKSLDQRNKLVPKHSQLSFEEAQSLHKQYVSKSAKLMSDVDLWCLRRRLTEEIAFLDGDSKVRFTNQHV